MKKISYILLVLVAGSLSACAPAYYEASYHDHYEPSGRLSVHASNNYVIRDYRPVFGHHYESIEVTLVADRSIVGVNFHPIHLVIHDGDFVEIPIRNKRGIHKSVYAHYQRGDLHFDADRHCAEIQASSRYKYDKRWDRGHRYDHVNAGPDFDLRGVGLVVRKHESKRAKHTVQNATIQKNAKSRYAPVPSKITSKTGASKGKTHEVDHNSRNRHLDSRSATAGIEKVKAVKRQVVVKERLVKRPVKSKDKKVAAGKDKWASRQIAERRSNVQSKNTYQESSDTPRDKAGSNNAIKAEKQLKNKHLKTKVKGKIKTRNIKNRKSERGVNVVDEDGFVALSGDESAVLIERHDKTFAGSRIKRNR